MNLQNCLTIFALWKRNSYTSVKSSRSKQSRIQNIRAVGCCQNNNIGLAIKAIHFHQNLVQSLLAFIMTATHTRATLTTHGINLINKDNAWSIFLSLRKQISHSTSTNTNKHFHKFRTGDREEWHASLTGNSTSQHSLARTWITD